jgi:hypothetical protein
MGDERGDVLLDRLSHVAAGLLDRAAVAETAGQARAAGAAAVVSGSFSITISKL